jgi:hypothetical protein
MLMVSWSSYSYSHFGMFVAGFVSSLSGLDPTLIRSFLPLKSKTSGGDVRARRGLATCDGFMMHFTCRSTNHLQAGNGCASQRTFLEGATVRPLRCSARAVQSSEGLVRGR